MSDFEKIMNIYNGYIVYEHNFTDIEEVYFLAKRYSKKKKEVEKFSICGGSIVLKLHEVDFIDKEGYSYSVYLGFYDTNNEKIIFEFVELPDDITFETELEQKTACLRINELYNDGEEFDKFFEIFGYKISQERDDGNRYNNKPYTNYLKNKLSKEEISRILEYFDNSSYTIKIDVLEYGVSITSQDGVYHRLGSIPMRKLLNSGEIEYEFPK